MLIFVENVETTTDQSLTGTFKILCSFCLFVEHKSVYFIIIINFFEIWVLTLTMS